VTNVTPKSAIKNKRTFLVKQSVALFSIHFERRATRSNKPEVHPMNLPGKVKKWRQYNGSNRLRKGLHRPEKTTNSYSLISSTPIELAASKWTRSRRSIMQLFRSSKKPHPLTTPGIRSGTRPQVQSQMDTIAPGARRRGRNQDFSILSLLMRARKVLRSRPRISAALPLPLIFH